MLVLTVMVLMLIYLLAAVFILPGNIVYAEDKQFAESCEYNGKKIISDFSSDKFASVIKNMEPGDTLTYKIKYKNGSKKTTLWYLKNSVLETLEDNSDRARNGGYSYKLSNKGPDGEQVFFNNDEVGGELVVDGLRGLKQATMSTENFFFIQQLAPGKHGTVTLFVGLDGETTVNDYMDTKGALLLKLGVKDKEDGDPDDPDKPDKPDKPNPPKRKDPPVTTVRTGDMNRIMFYTALLTVSLVMLILALIFWRRSRKDGDDA